MIPPATPVTTPSSTATTTTSLFKCLKTSWLLWFFRERIIGSINVWNFVIRVKFKFGYFFSCHQSFLYFFIIQTPNFCWNTYIFCGSVFKFHSDNNWHYKTAFIFHVYHIKVFTRFYEFSVVFAQS